MTFKGKYVHCFSNNKSFPLIVIILLTQFMEINSGRFRSRTNEVDLKYESRREGGSRFGHSVFKGVRHGRSVPDAIETKPQHHSSATSKNAKEAPSSDTILQIPIDQLQSFLKDGKDDADFGDDDMDTGEDVAIVTEPPPQQVQKAKLNLNINLEGTRTHQLNTTNIEAIQLDDGEDPAMDEDIRNDPSLNILHVTNTDQHTPLIKQSTISESPQTFINPVTPIPRLLKLSVKPSSQTIANPINGPQISGLILSPSKPETKPIDWGMVRKPNFNLRPVEFVKPLDLKDDEPITDTPSVILLPMTHTEHLKTDGVHPVLSEEKLDVVANSESDEKMDSIMRISAAQKEHQDKLKLNVTLEGEATIPLPIITDEDDQTKVHEDSVSNDHSVNIVHITNIDHHTTFIGQSTDRSQEINPKNDSATKGLIIEKTVNGTTSTTNATNDKIQSNATVSSKQKLELKLPLEPGDIKRPAELSQRNKTVITSKTKSMSHMSYPPLLRPPDKKLPNLVNITQEKVKLIVVTTETTVLNLKSLPSNSSIVKVTNNKQQLIPSQPYNISLGGINWPSNLNATSNRNKQKSLMTTPPNVTAIFGNKQKIIPALKPPIHTVSAVDQALLSYQLLKKSPNSTTPAPIKIFRYGKVYKSKRAKTPKDDLPKDYY